MTDYLTRPHVERNDNEHHEREDTLNDARNVRQRLDVSQAETRVQRTQTDTRGQREEQPHKRRRIDRLRRTPDSESNERSAQGTMMTGTASTASPGGPDT